MEVGWLYVLVCSVAVMNAQVHAVALRSTTVENAVARGAGSTLYILINYY